MKINLFCFLLCFFVLSAYGQQKVMKVYRSNGETLVLECNEVDSILFADKREEDTTVIVGPIDQTTDESFWMDMAQYDAAMSAMFLKAREFARYQLYVEDFLLKVKTERGPGYRIDPAESFVSSLWAKGYGTINMANRVIKYSKDTEEYQEYYKQALAMRAFIYYNMAMLWGNIPYTKECAEAELGYTDIVQEKAEIIYQDLLNDLSAIEVAHTENYYFSNAAIAVLKLEIERTLGDAGEEVSQVHNDVIFYFPEVTDNFTSLIGAGTLIYTRGYYDLLCKEPLYEKPQLPELWKDMNNDRYGYWALLKRSGLAIEISGLRPHELLLPIPKMEMLCNTSLVQNPGYDEDM